MERMQIAEWDVLLVGDGSGTGWNDANAYASVLIDKLTRGRKTFWGGNRYGSVNLAEMEAVLKPLIWYHNEYGKKRLKIRTPQIIHVLTDSQVTAGHGARTANPREPLPEVPHRPLWAAMREFARMGYQLEYHWAKRCDSDLNILSDLIAGLTRREILGVEVTEPYLIQRAKEAIESIEFIDPESGDNYDVYTVNPDGVL